MRACRDWDDGDGCARYDYGQETAVIGSCGTYGGWTDPQKVAVWGAAGEEAKARNQEEMVGCNCHRCRRLVPAMTGEEGLESTGVGVQEEHNLCCQLGYGQSFCAYSDLSPALR